jgi:hypothetical protein
MIRTTYSLLRSTIIQLLTTNYEFFDQRLIEVEDTSVGEINNYAWNNWVSKGPRPRKNSKIK